MLYSPMGMRFREAMRSKSALPPQCVTSLVQKAVELQRIPPLLIGPYTLRRPIILAPMAGVSEAPFREIILHMGAGLAPTELVSAKGLLYKNARTESYLRHNAEAEPLLVVQIFGGEASSMAVAAERAVEAGAKMVDINMGCPVKKVTRTGAGSALMTDPQRAAAIVSAMRERVSVPITAKIRSGWDKEHQNALEVGRALEEAGVAAIAIHPRTRQQGYSGSADWSMIKALVDTVQIPVIANGDIFTVADANRVVRETGCHGIMVGRGALGNPWIIEQLAAAYDGRPLPAPPVGARRAYMILHHLEAHIAHHGHELRALKKFRQHLIWYSRGMRDGHAFRERVMVHESRTAVEEEIKRFFGGVQVQNFSESPIYDERTALG
ncbi:MAG: tRNA dihydrouridine synthase DusB [Myxococcales bacterium]|nr:tRNA dihydrouridine synthase DusB [Myxococcales bacterium]